MSGELNPDSKVGFANFGICRVRRGRQNSEFVGHLAQAPYKICPIFQVRVQTLDESYALAISVPPIEQLLRPPILHTLRLGAQPGF